MRVMVMIKANSDSENGVMPPPEYLEKMMKFNEMLVNKGIMLAAEGLHPSNRAKRVRCEIGKKPVVLEFWATWCSICAALQPRLDAAERRALVSEAERALHPVNVASLPVERIVETPGLRELKDRLGLDTDF